ncbi:hypothetical protein I5W21_10080 [Stenotrophomonas maltophilia]|uniref:DUF4440 domain-containing protein n=1 Tax=Stenotrophomonas maltophilia TaxID=40324 RepID=A0AA40XVN6_STEMA|nr:MULTISPECIES: hypothetical protein [Stenotrophomonas]MBH1639209.1 hypothetical protein [Stenotrophomonas maltophilia]HCL45252.1 hypothetical protein [Pseudomonas sp.]MBH1839995.1 hypothetical protein [Stenotrophomonas maltophilia]MBN5129680.1 hypothetical protein [Stenotrophomonas maltophilia]MBN5133732.1 hypothetical protein [Stenotrophomonas maltophilia]
MPMLALMLLLSSLFGAGNEPTEEALRSQILIAETQRPEAVRQDCGSPSLLLYRLRQDRVLRLANQPVQREPADAQPTRGATVRVAQLWERVDGHWKLQRMISVEDLAVQR